MMLDIFLRFTDFLEKHRIPILIAVITMTIVFLWITPVYFGFALLITAVILPIILICSFYLRILNFILFEKSHSFYEIKSIWKKSLYENTSHMKSLN